MKKKLKVIDGTPGVEYAPVPRRGLMRAVVLTVDELGGATFAQVHRYLGAQDSRFEGASKDHVGRSLYDCVYSGHLITNGDKYHRAPLGYYQERQSRRRKKSREGSSKWASKGTPGNTLPQPPVTAPFEQVPGIYWTLLANSVLIALLLGLVVGAVLL